MEITVKGTVYLEVGPQTMAMLSGSSWSGKKPIEVKDEKKVVEVEAPQAPEPPKRTRRTKEQVEAEKETKANPFAEMDDDDKQEAIKQEVVKHTKKGNSKDIKFMLAQFDALSVSTKEPLKVEDYDAFYEALVRYGKGESVEDIFETESFD